MKKRQFKKQLKATKAKYDLWEKEYASASEEMSNSEDIYTCQAWSEACGYISGNINSALVCGGIKLMKQQLRLITKTLKNLETSYMDNIEEMEEDDYFLMLGWSEATGFAHKDINRFLTKKIQKKLTSKVV